MTSQIDASADRIDVSIIIPCWCAGEYVGKSISSALASTSISLEIIAVDDASPDDTFTTLQNLAKHEPRLKVDRLNTNSGPSGARNRAIELARGRFIAVLDADDEITPDRLVRMVATAEARKADIVVDNMLEVDEHGQRLNTHAFLQGTSFLSDHTVTLGDYVRLNHPMKAGDCLGYLKPLFRRTTLDAHNARYDPALRNSEDYYIVANMLADGAVMSYIAQPGYLYQRAAGSTSHRLKPEQTAAWLDAEARFRDRNASKLNEAETTELDLRLRHLRNVHQLIGATEAIKARKPVSLVRTLAATPRSLPYTLSWFAQLTWRKAFGGQSSSETELATSTSSAG